MANTDLIYGDRPALAASIAAASAANRPTVLFGIGDSIINKWWPAFVMRMKGIVGYDDKIAQLYRSTGSLLSPIGPGAFVGKFNTFQCFSHTGGATTTSALSIGGTSVPLSALNSGGGWPDFTMPVIIDVGANAELVYIDPSWTGFFGNGPSYTPLIVSALTKNHASGVPVTWMRPSGQTAYYPSYVTEVAFSTAAAPAVSGGNANRLADFSLLGDTVGYGDASESALFSDGFCFNRFSLDIILLHLALPVNSGAPNLQLYATTAETSPSVVTQNFSIYAATPTIQAVKLTLPAPAIYNSTKVCDVRIYAANAGNFTGPSFSGGVYTPGQVFVPLAVIVRRKNSNGGPVILNATAGGMQFQDILGDNSRFGPMWSTAYRLQLVAALNGAGLGTIDQYMIHLGTNNTAASSAAMLLQIQQAHNDMASANPNVTTIYVSDYATTANTGSGAIATMSGAAQSIEGLRQIVSFDQAAMADVTPADFTALYSGDGTHPNAAGTPFVANRISNFYQAAGYAGATNVLSGIKTTAGVGTQIAIPSNANAGVCQAIGYVYDANDNPLVGEIVEYRINAGNGVNTAIINRRVHQATSGANGLVTISMLKGYTYGVRYDQGDFIDFPVPASGATCSLSQVLGRMGS